MIALKNINKYYQQGKINKLHILKSINLEISKGEFISIMGASGCGKSTLLNILGILDFADEGEYKLNDSVIGKLSENEAAEYRNKFIGFIFQTFSLIGYKNALENVELPLYYQGMPSKERKEKAKEILDKVGLYERINFMPNELSGGQKQRVAIARALVTNPKVILADEPTGALDSDSSKDILNLLEKINLEGNTIVMVTHELEMAKRANRILHMKDGEIIL